MLVVTISFYGAGINFGRAKVLKCLKCGKERMVFNVLPPQIDLEVGDMVEGEVVLQFVGKDISNTGKHFWALHNGLEKSLLPAGYVSRGLPFVLKDIIVIPQEIAGMYRKKHSCLPISEFTTDYPYPHVVEVMANSIRPLKAEDEVMCPTCYRDLTEEIQGSLRGKVLCISEYPPRLYSTQQTNVRFSKYEMDIFGHKINILNGSGRILLRLPEATIFNYSDTQKLVVGITHPSHEYVEIVIPDSSYYLYLYHPWPWFRGD